MGLPRAQVARIRTAATVHDVGKVETPDEIVNKPGALSEEEFAVVKRHPVDGARMVAGLKDEELTRIVRHHHERLDGMGYPDGLAGEEIPVGARVIAVADTFDAITSTRPYRAARRHREALELLAAEAGTQLDPDAVRAFRRYYSGLRPVALWALFLHGPRQLLTVLGEQVRFGGVAMAAQATTVAVATVAAGSLAVGALPRDDEAQGQSARAVATQLPAPPGTGDGTGLRTSLTLDPDPPKHAGAPAAAPAPSSGREQDSLLSEAGAEAQSGVDLPGPGSTGSAGGDGSDDDAAGGDGSGGDRGGRTGDRNTTIEDTTTRVTEPVRSTVDTTVDTVDKTVDTVDKTVDTVDTTVDTVDKTVDTVDSAIAELRETITNRQ